mmetsp:Transcript_30956/g.75536  ORF Transcript_30956/g.75536 Transcript_30956/m.75536 type:complete len:327 (-) Transcript_30956:2481-3461(-)
MTQVAHHDLPPRLDDDLRDRLEAWAVPALERLERLDAAQQLEGEVGEVRAPRDVDGAHPPLVELARHAHREVVGPRAADVECARAEEGHDGLPPHVADDRRGEGDEGAPVHWEGGQRGDRNQAFDGQALHETAAVEVNFDDRSLLQGLQKLGGELGDVRVAVVELPLANKRYYRLPPPLNHARGGVLEARAASDVKRDQAVILEYLVYGEVLEPHAPADVNLADAGVPQPQQGGHVLHVGVAEVELLLPKEHHHGDPPLRGDGLGGPLEVRAVVALQRLDGLEGAEELDGQRAEELAATHINALNLRLRYEPKVLRQLLQIAPPEV